MQKRVALRLTSLSSAAFSGSGCAQNAAVLKHTAASIVSCGAAL